MNVALAIARLGYLVVGLAALMIGWERREAADSSAGLVLLAGGLAVAAAAWVTSDGVVRGALASVGIVAGAVMVAMTSFTAASVIGCTSVIRLAGRCSRPRSRRRWPAP